MLNHKMQHGWVVHAAMVGLPRCPADAAVDLNRNVRFVVPLLRARFDVRTSRNGRPHQSTGRRREARGPVSPNVIISLLGGLLAALLGVLGTLLVLQLNALGNNSDSLRSEMQAEFREVNATLLDHTDRLARLEAAVTSP